MPRRARKLIGGGAMLVFVVFYALVAMALAQARPLQEAPALVQNSRLCHSGPRLDPAADAAHQMDGAA